MVSILIYEVLKLIRGTRAVQMALGGGVLVALFYGSRWGHLETVNWLIRNLAGYIVFAVIVLFQSDIRRALRAFRPRAVLPLFREGRSRRRSRSRSSWSPPSLLSSQRDRRDHRDRAADRPAQLHRGRHPPRRAS